MTIAFSQVRAWLIDTKRQWYLDRWIPNEICEDDWMHTKRATQACVSHLLWSPERIEDKKNFPLMGFWHELVEWEPGMKDYTPYSNITPEEKHRLESEVLHRLRQWLWSRYSRLLDKTWEYLEQKTSDSREFFYIDKSLAGVWGLEYERQWFTWLEDFHPYALDKLSADELHTRIYEILLEREFQNVDYFTQYFLLLRFSWDRDRFRRELNWT